MLAKIIHEFRALTSLVRVCIPIALTKLRTLEYFRSVKVPCIDEIQHALDSRNIGVVDEDAVCRSFLCIVL